MTGGHSQIPVFALRFSIPAAHFPDQRMPNATLPLLSRLIDREVVVDVASRYVYLGRLVGGDEKFLTLDDADVHDLRDTATTREEYVLAARRHGLAPNRARVYVRTAEVVSISLLEDVIA